MKYVLLLALEYKKYKNNFTIRIFSDQTLIDELIIDEEIPLKKVDRSRTSIIYRKRDDLQFYYKTPYFPKDNKKMFRHPKKIFLYEINETVLGKEIKLETNDRNSNFTNGFISKSNQFRIANIFLFPKDIFKENYFKKICKIWKFHNKGSIDPYSVLTPEDFDKKVIYWPGIGTVRDEYNNLFNGEWHGGVKKLRVLLYKKFNIYMVRAGMGIENYCPVYCFNADILEYDEIYGILNTLNEDQ